MAEIVRLDPQHPDAGIMARVAARLREGALVAFPTETVYGLGAHALDRTAVRRIFAAKGRPSTDPLIVHVHTAEAARMLVTNFPPDAVILSSRLWPGPLTLVLPRASLVPHDVTAGLETVALRVPSHPIALALVREAGIPIAAPSANLFSRPSPTTAQHVIDDLGGVIDIILDAGPTTIGVESTVVDVTRTPPAVLRPGGVSLERLRELIPAISLPPFLVETGNAMPAPGMLTRHYAPRTPMALFEGPLANVVARVCTELATGGPATVVLGTHEALDAVRVALGDVGRGDVSFVDLGSTRHPAAIAHSLYAKLRECDLAEAERVIACQIDSDEGLFCAIRDRLRRAASGHVVPC